ncbi:MAG TPA: extracellular solute-binding protein [Chloroflexota bacterium]|nr:extracellular solute-binding protein [Chloroflexota bacterium]
MAQTGKVTFRGIRRGKTRRWMMEGGVLASALASGGVLAAACSGSERAGTAPNPSQGPVTLVVNTIDARREGPIYEEIYRAAEARRPGLKTDLVVAGPEKVIAMASAGTPMDVVRVSGSRDFTSFACKGLILPVDEYLKRGDYPVKDAMPIAMQGVEWRGKHYGITFNLGANVVYFNKTLFERKAAKLPTEYQRDRRWTWEAFQEAARSVSGGTGTDQTWGLDRITCLCQVNALIYTAGGEMYDKEMRVSRFDHPQTVEALQFLTDLMLRHRATPSLPERKELGKDPLLLGRGGMRYTARFDARPIDEAAQHDGWQPGMVLPATGPSGKVVTRESPVSMAIGQGTKHPEDAWLVVRTWGDAVGQKLYVGNGLGLPVLKTMWDQPFVKETLFPWEDLATYKRSVELAYIQVPPVYPEVASVFNRELDLMQSGQKSVKDGMTTLKREADSLLASVSCSA